MPNHSQNTWWWGVTRRENQQGVYATAITELDTKKKILTKKSQSLNTKTASCLDDIGNY